MANPLQRGNNVENIDLFSCEKEIVTCDFVEECRQTILEEVGFFFALHYKTVPLFVKALLNGLSKDLTGDFYRYLVSPQELQAFFLHLSNRLGKDISRHFSQQVQAQKLIIEEEKIKCSLDKLQRKLKDRKSNLSLLQDLEKALDLALKKNLAAFCPLAFLQKAVLNLSLGKKAFSLTGISSSQYKATQEEIMQKEIKGILANLEQELTTAMLQQVTATIYSLYDQLETA